MDEKEVEKFIENLLLKDTAVRLQASSDHRILVENIHSDISTILKDVPIADFGCEVSETDDEIKITIKATKVTEKLLAKRREEANV